MCGVWLAFEDIGPEQGPLVYYPGSHKWPIYTRQHIGERYTLDGGRHQSVFEPLWERLVEVSGIEPIRFHARKGQALIWAANLLHGGDYHRDRNLTRWSQVTHYYFDDCVYYTPLASNEPEGDLFRRDPVDIQTALGRPSSYLGKKIDEQMVASAEAPPPGFDAERYLRLNPDVCQADKALSKSNFLGAGNLKALALFKDADKFCCVEKTIGRAGIQPGITAAHDLYVQLPPL